jgi:HTH-type transcriptional regulator/antitoxin HigA
MATPRTKDAATPKAKARNPTRHKVRQPRARPAPGEAYFALVRRFPLRPIESDAELEGARAVLNELLDRDSLSRDQEDYLDVLGDLLDKYERANHPLPPVSGLDMLRHFLDTRGVTHTQASRGAGIAASTLSSILTGKRRMNRDHIEALARYFRVPPGLFLEPLHEMAGLLPTVSEGREE